MTKANNAATAAQDTGKQETAEIQEAKSLEELKAENESLKALIGELNAALAEKDSEIEKKGGRPIIKDGKDSYELRLNKFVHRIDGKAVEVDEAYLKAHPELVKDLIAKKSGALIKKGGK